MNESDCKVKGTVLLDYVRMIRAASDKNWDKHLKKEDFDMLNGRVLASLWYPYGHFYRCGKAVFEELAGGSLDITRQFGKLNADTLFKGTYKAVLESALSNEASVIRFLERYAAMTPTMFNFVKVEIKKITEKHVQLAVNLVVTPKEMLAEPYFFQLAGTIERLVEMSGGKNPKVKFLSKVWEGAPNTSYDVTWE